MIKETAKHKKKVFTIIEVNHTKQQKQNTIDYSVNLAKATARDLVFYFLGKIERAEYRNFIKTVHESKKSIYQNQVNHCMYDIKISYNREETTWSQSINDIAVKENAAFILMGVDDEKKTFLQKIFGKTMWGIATNSDNPVILIPPTAKFCNFEEMTIAVDEENKLWKMSWVKQIHHKFKTKVNIFVKSTGESQTDNISSTVLNNITDMLHREGIEFHIEFARENVNFDKHLLRYAAKNSHLLIIEVNEGYIDATIKKNIQKLLYHTNQQFAVMLVKTKVIGQIRWI